MSEKGEISSNIVKVTDYKMIKVMKRSTFGVVHFVEHTRTHQQFAAKVNIRNSDSNHDSMISKNIESLISIQGPTIIQFGGFSLTDFENKPQVTIFTDWKEKRSLQELFDDGPTDGYDNTAKQIILCGIAHGMMILHSRRVIHMNLKPGNVLLDSEFLPYISDFGLLEFMDPENTKCQSILDGTTTYIAPEIFQGNNYSHKADVYSFGILMYEIITGEEAFSDIIHNKQTTIESFSSKIIEGMRPTFTKPIKPGLKKLIEQCWSNDPNERPTFEEIFSKLSQPFDDDDISKARAKAQSGASDFGEEDINSHPYCLNGVDIDSISSYLKDIITTHPAPAPSTDNNYQQIVNEFTKQIDKIQKENEQTIEQLKAQNEQIIEQLMIQNKQTIEQLKKQNEQAIEQLKGDNEKVIQNLIGQNAQVIENLKLQNEQAVRELTQRVVDLEKQNQVKSEEIRKQKAVISDLKKKISSSPVTNPLNILPFPKLSRTYSQGICCFLLTNRVDFENNQTVTITAFPDANNDQLTLNTIISEEMSEKAWCSKNHPNAHILFDFQNRSVCLNAFHLWTGEDPENGRHMKSIQFSGSNDGEEWTTPIKFECHCNRSNESSYGNTFEHFWGAAFYRYIKLESPEPNWKGTNEIYLKRIEFFGQLQLNTNTNPKSAHDIGKTFSNPESH